MSGATFYAVFGEQLAEVSDAAAAGEATAALEARSAEPRLQGSPASGARSEAADRCSRRAGLLAV